MKLVRWSEKASDQIVAAYEQMAAWGEDYAERQTSLIWDAAEMLRQFPFMGSPVPDSLEVVSSNERHLFVPGTYYFIFYRVDEDVVHIAAVVYAPLTDLTSV